MLVKFSGLPHGFELLESNIHSQDEPFSSELAMLMVGEMPLIYKSTLNPMPPCGKLSKL
jgi:hypothetical protein